MVHIFFKDSFLEQSLPSLHPCSYWIGQLQPLLGEGSMALLEPLRSYVSGKTTDSDCWGSFILFFPFLFLLSCWFSLLWGQWQCRTLSPEALTESPSASCCPWVIIHKTHRIPFLYILRSTTYDSHVSLLQVKHTPHTVFGKHQDCGSIRSMCCLKTVTWFPKWYSWAPLLRLTKIRLPLLSQLVVRLLIVVVICKPAVIRKS